LGEKVPLLSQFCNWLAILDYLEDLDDVSVAEARLSDLRAGKGRTHTLEDVERDLWLAD
jgi:RHH-type rel operon transcriptional repressor/antitoxin RelB